MSTNYYGGRRRRFAPPAVARWLTLRYDSTCKVCHTELPAGTRAFWDPAPKNATCTNIECAKADGLTKSEWFGAPTSGRWVDVLNDHRIGQPAATVPMVEGKAVEYHEYQAGVFRYLDGSDGRWFKRTRYGIRAGVENTGIRCIDAPCCGCC